MKKIWEIGKTYVFLLLFVIADTVISFISGNKILIFASLGVALAAAAITIIDVLSIQKNISTIIKSVSHGISTAQSRALTELKVPVLIATGNGELVWYNPYFERHIAGADGLIGMDSKTVFGDEILEQLSDSKKSEVVFGQKTYSVARSIIDDGEILQIYYFFDITKQKKAEEEYELSRPTVIIIELDNIDELTKSAKESEIAAFKGEIQKCIEKWSNGENGICRKLPGNKYIFIMEERSYRRIVDDRFSLLETVREHKFGDNGYATVSIGVGTKGESLAECEELAMQALDMALGRGGDQAVVKKPGNEYKFYGGVSGGVEKRTRIRARVISSALKELIAECDKVILMGHRFADLDCFGSCFALNSAIHSLGKQAYIVLDTAKSAAKPLVSRLKTLNAEFSVVEPQDASALVTRNTLLIVTDVHRSTFFECPELYEKCEKVVIIDHHRKAVDFVKDSVIFYHETSVSSTCEMVTELLQYMCPKCVGQAEAEALLSGIMLDTRSYVLNTGTRTFEASAFLRTRGADPVTVKKLFCGSMDAYKLRAQIVASAEIYDGDCAIAIDREEGDNTRVAASQAADELLGIEGVLGSFVLSHYGSGINISARSFGGMNVQLIMEMLGGGGHRTMAACQLNVDNFDAALDELVKAIDKYKEEIKH